jgi:hypothetical protein
MIDEYKKVLFKNQEGYPSDQLRGHLLEQYKLYIEMADRISSRRQSANSFFLSLNTTLVALGGCPRTQKMISRPHYIVFVNIITHYILW